MVPQRCLSVPVSHTNTRKDRKAGCICIFFSFICLFLFFTPSCVTSVVSSPCSWRLSLCPCQANNRPPAELTAFSHYYVCPVSRPCPDTSADIAVIAMWPRAWLLSHSGCSGHFITHNTQHTHTHAHTHTHTHTVRERQEFGAEV